MKVFNLLLASFSIFFLTACNDDDTYKDSLLEKEAYTGKIYKGVVLQFTDVPVFIRMRRGFTQELIYSAYIERMKLDYKIADGDIEKLESLAREINNSDYDFIVTAGTVATHTMMQLKTDIPLIYMGVNDPYSAGLSLNPEAHTTGTVLPVPLANIFKLMQEMLNTDIERIGIIHYNKEVNAIKIVENTKLYLDGVDLKYKEMILDRPPTSEELEYFMEDIDALFIPNEYLTGQQMPIIYGVAQKKHIPIFCADPFTHGILASAATNYVDVGVETAYLLIEFLNGKKMEEIPTKTMNTVSFYINRRIANSLGLAIPSHIDTIITLD